MSEFWYKPDFDLGEFRYAVARYVRLLIRARWKFQPGFLSATELERWELTDIDADNYPASRLLHDAATTLGRLNTEFIPRCGSGGFQETDPGTAVGRLMMGIPCLVDSIGGGPYHNSALLDASHALRLGLSVDWQVLADWTALADIRDDLDQLPHPQNRPSDSEASTGSIPQTAEPYIFRRAGEDWMIRFDGGVLFPITKLVGVGYIHTLIREPGKVFSGLQMSDSRHQFDPSNAGRSHLGAQLAASHDPHFSHGAIADRTFDHEALREIREERNSNRSAIDKARKDGDDALVQRLEDEGKELEDQLSKDLDVRGAGRIMKNEEDKARRSVRKAIQYAKDQISKKDAQLGRHLSNSIGAHEFVYRPDRDIAWKLD